MKPSKMAKSNRPAVAESNRSAVAESNRSAVITREMLARARVQKRAEESTEGRERVAMGIMEYQSEMAWQFAERKAEWQRLRRERDARAGA